VLGLAASMSACGDDDPGAQQPDAGTDVVNADSNPPDRPPATRLSRPSHGSTLDISEDDTIIITANRELGTVTIFDVSYTADLPPTLTKKAEVQVGGEPYQVVLSPDGNRAFVVLRKDQKLVRIDNVRSTPVKGLEAPVGSEPTGVALSPRGRAAFVANWMDGTVTEVDTEKMTVTSTIDLNAALVASGVLGPNVTARPALAHPRSLAITNNNDDVESDETLFVTEYYGQWKEQLAPNGSNADIAKQGLVYQIKLSDKNVSTVKLPPIADIGIKDHEGKAAGCYPNQLQSINITGSFAYVLSICASPKGPLGDYLGPAAANCNTDDQCPGGGAGTCTAGKCTTNCTTNDQCGLEGVCTNNVCEENLIDGKTLQTPAVSVIDIGGSSTIASVSLNGEFEKFFIAQNVPDTTARRYPLHAADIGFIPGSLTAWIPAHGSNAVYRVDFNATYEEKAIDAVGSAARPFISLDRGAFNNTKRGEIPVGIAVAHQAKPETQFNYAFVMNDGSRNVTTIDLTTEEIAGTLPDNPAVTSFADLPSPGSTEFARLEGRKLFELGTGRWSFRGQAWGACSTCHWEGLSDQVTWFHRRGSRQSPSVDQTINKKNPSDIRGMNWQASSDELADNENGALRVVLGGVGAIVKNTDLTPSARIDFGKYGHSGLNGSITVAADPDSPSTLVGEVCAIDDWKLIDVFEKSLRTPRRPSNLDPAKVAQGKDVFMEGNCQGCHGGDKWTLSRVFYTPDPVKESAEPGQEHTNVNNALKTRSWRDTVLATEFPQALLPTLTESAQTMRYNGTNASSFDVLTCLLRNVGTFNVTEPGVGVAELRRNMSTAAQGNEDTSRGYNVPSLLGMGVAAPYFHAGMARTLEAALSEPFQTHLRALNPNFLTGQDAATKREALIQFLLSLDADTTTIPVPALGANGGDFCSAP